jgi:hypothetical protein
MMTAVSMVAKKVVESGEQRVVMMDEPWVES